MAVAEGLEPSHGRINSAVPYQLGYATRTGGDEGIRTLIDRFTRPTLYEPFELHRRELRTSYLVLCTLFLSSRTLQSLQGLARTNEEQSTKYKVHLF